MKKMENQIYPGMFFSVFARNAAIFKRNGRTENKVYLSKS
jgi:3,4-dihydroxy-2-butanone 4-phosphate synthase